jgi:hypothetical protein
MAWNSRYSLISHARSSLWTVLILSIVAAFVLKRLAVRPEAVRWHRVVVGRRVCRLELHDPRPN